MSKQTSLYQEHQQLGAKLVDFAGWSMPIHYTSQIQEHHAVRQHAGLFDVSHMGVLELTGKQTTEFLRYVLANDVAKLTIAGRALYTCMLNPQGGVIDDLIVYRLGDTDYRIVLNASRRDVDVNWLKQHAKNFSVQFNLRNDLCILALQGPQAIAQLIVVLGDSVRAVENLKPFHTLLQNDLQIARTGYTGEDGVEIILPATQAVTLWQKLIAAGVTPCGLGARDTLRLEAGLNLYGCDMNEQTSPLISNLSWTVALQDAQRDFIGRNALEKQQAAGIEQQLVGLVMTDKGVLRNHQPVFSNGQQIGEITSGSFSPTLGHAIALARLPTTPINDPYIDRRGTAISVKIVKPPFVRHGKKLV